MGETLRLYEDFQHNANQDLTDKEFKVYLSMMRRVFFEENTNIPKNGTEVVKYSWTIAKADGIKISKQGFYNIMDSLIEKNYLMKFKLGYYSGKHEATEYRLKRF